MKNKMSQLGKNRFLCFFLLLGIVSTLQAIPMETETITRATASDPLRVRLVDARGNNNASEARGNTPSISELTPAAAQDNDSRTPLFNLADFERALTENSQAARFVIREQDETFSLQAQEEGNNDEQNRNENNAIMNALNDAIRAFPEYSEMDVRSMFQISSEIQDASSLSAEKLRQVFGALETSKSLYGMIQRDETNHPHHYNEADTLWNAFRTAWHEDWSTAQEKSASAQESALIKTKAREAAEKKLSEQDRDKTRLAVARDITNQGAQVATLIPEPHCQTIVMPVLSLFSIGADTVNKIFQYLSERSVEQAKRTEQSAQTEAASADAMLRKLQLTTLELRRQAQRAEESLHITAHDAATNLATAILDKATGLSSNQRVALDMARSIWFQKMKVSEQLLEEVNKAQNKIIEPLQQEWKRATTSAVDLRTKVNIDDEELTALMNHKKNIKVALQQANDELSNLRQRHHSPEEEKTKLNEADALKIKYNNLVDKCRGLQSSTKINHAVATNLEQDALQATRAYLSQEDISSREIARVQIRLAADQQAWEAVLKKSKEIKKTQASNIDSPTSTALDSVTPKIQADEEVAVVSQAAPRGVNLGNDVQEKEQTARPSLYSNITKNVKETAKGILALQTKIRSEAAAKAYEMMEQAEGIPSMVSTFVRPSVNNDVVDSSNVVSNLEGTAQSKLIKEKINIVSSKKEDYLNKEKGIISGPSQKLVRPAVEAPKTLDGEVLSGLTGEAEAKAAGRTLIESREAEQRAWDYIARGSSSVSSSYAELPQQQAAAHITAAIDKLSLLETKHQDYLIQEATIDAADETWDEFAALAAEIEEMEAREKAKITNNSYIFK